jgi:alpha-beta hydrolase superfamily lysophospholipase
LGCVVDPNPSHEPRLGRSDWRPDVLDGYEATTLVLGERTRVVGEPVDTEMVATLVRRSPDRPAAVAALRRAVLYLHGWNDYFFQTHLADELAASGFDFYALDLRRFGRSLRAGHLPGFIADLDDYGDELAWAADLIGADHDELVLMGHSTGGLIAALWAAQYPDRVQALVLNSPWLDLQGSAMMRAIGSPVIDAVGSSRPTSVLRLPDLGFYPRSLHVSFGAEWDYDLAWKSTPGPPIRAGWLRAVRLGHQRVAGGLQLPMPALVLASAASDFARRWHEGLRQVDTVLDVEQIAQRATRLGRHVTIVRIDQGLHDLVLSPPAVRERVFAELARWLTAYASAPRDPLVKAHRHGG